MFSAAKICYFESLFTLRKVCMVSMCMIYSLKKMENLDPIGDASSVMVGAL